MKVSSYEKHLKQKRAAEKKLAHAPTAFDRFQVKLARATAAATAPPEPMMSDPCTCGGKPVHVHVAFPSTMSEEEIGHGEAMLRRYGAVEVEG